MTFLDKKIKIRLIVLILIGFSLFGCANTPTLTENDRDIFYTYNKLSSEIDKLGNKYPDIITQQIIGKTYEGRAIYIVRITGNNSDKLIKPGILAIFAEHSAEHDVTVLSIGLIKYLAENYGKDEKITKLLNKKVVYIAPMMNPDGVEFDLSGEVKPFTWRKNRRPVGDEEYGVDLNRNWGLKWNIPAPVKLAKKLKDKGSPNYAGEVPFSENETKSVRDFILSQSDIKIIVDYHSGGGGFMQGMVLYPGPFLKHDKNISLFYKNRYKKIAKKFAREMSNPNDQRPAIYVNENQNVALQMRKYFPWYMRLLIPNNIPYPPGTSSEWTVGEMKIISFGVELTRDTTFFRNPNENLNTLIENQARGFLFLLRVVSGDPFNNL